LLVCCGMKQNEACMLQLSYHHAAWQSKQAAHCALLPLDY
jgi:hypothetical protein